MKKLLFGLLFLVAGNAYAVERQYYGTLIEVRQKSANMAQTFPVLWVGASTTVNGVVSFNLTDNDGGDGAALVSSTYTIAALAWNNTGTPASMPYVSGKTVSADLKTVTINVLANGAAAPDGTRVDLMVVGNK